MLVWGFCRAEMAQDNKPVEILQIEQTESTFHRKNDSNLNGSITL